VHRYGRGMGVSWLDSAAELRRAHQDVDRLALARDTGATAWRAWEEAAARFNESVQRFYAPLKTAMPSLRRGEPPAVAAALDFLEADPWCFRSGYMKADIMHALANAPLLGAQARERAQRVVLHRLLQPEPRLARHTARLAVAVWDDALDREVRSLGERGSESQRLHVAGLVDAVEQQRAHQWDRPHSERTREG
jgi:hypothetical protein